MQQQVNMITTHLDKLSETDIKWIEQNEKWAMEYANDLCPFKHRKDPYNFFTDSVLKIIANDNCLFFIISYAKELLIGNESYPLSYKMEPGEFKALVIEMHKKFEKKVDDLTIITL